MLIFYTWLVIDYTYTVIAEDLWVLSVTTFNFIELVDGPISPPSVFASLPTLPTALFNLPF